MINKVISTIEENNMIENGETILVAFSGGPDSVCLLHILMALKDKYNISIYAAHVNHMLRGEESFRDEEFSRSFCEENNIDFHLKRVDISLVSKNLKISTEEAGRKVRYDFFNEVLESINGKKIALAHNLNDNGETIIMRILRGTSLTGLTGISPKRQNIIRPILNCTREEIEKYCLDNRLNPVIDSTNLEEIYTRNKIRLKVIPYIKNNFNKNILENLHTNSEIAKDEEDMIASIVEESARNIEDKYGYNVKKFNELHIALRRRIVRYIIEARLGNLNGIEFKHIKLAVDFLKQNKTGKSLDIKKGLLLKIDYGTFNFESSYKEGKKNIELYNIFKENIFINEYKIKCDVIDKNNIREMHDNEVYFDYGKIKGNLVLRTRKAGDYIYLKGLKGKKKLKDVFIDMKVPRDIRDTVPILAIGNEVLIIVGLRSSESYKLDNETRKVLRVNFEGEY